MSGEDAGPGICRGFHRKFLIQMDYPQVSQIWENLSIVNLTVLPKAKVAGVLTTR